MGGSRSIPPPPPHSDYDVNLSPDGARIAFTSDRQGGASEIWIADRDGSDPMPVTRGTLSAGSPRWSPDSRQLVFDRLSEDGRGQSMSSIRAPASRDG